MEYTLWLARQKSWRDRYLDYERKCQQAAFKTGIERERAYKKLEDIHKELMNSSDLPESLRPRLAVEKPDTVDGIQAFFETELAVSDLVGTESEDIRALREWNATDFGSKYQPMFHKGDWNKLADRLTELVSVPQSRVTASKVRELFASMKKRFTKMDTSRDRRDKADSIKKGFGF
jgi:hypothetical protein